MKAIRGIYVEFNEVGLRELIYSPKELDEEVGELDSIFRIGRTDYQLFNHNLIIRINVAIVGNLFKERKPAGQYYMNYLNAITNKYDFFEQVFTPDQIIQFLYNKIEVERVLLQYSSEISE